VILGRRRPKNSALNAIIPWAAAAAPTAITQRGSAGGGTGSGGMVFHLALDWNGEVRHHHRISGNPGDPPDRHQSRMPSGGWRKAAAVREVLSGRQQIGAAVKG
jgi:hypothetical protein